MLIDVVSYYLFITVLFMLFSYPVHLHDSIIVWSHDICMCTIPTFLHTHWEFWLSRFTHPDIWLLYFIDQVFGKELMHYEEPEFSLLDHSFWYRIIPSSILLSSI